MTLRPPADLDKIEQHFPFQRAEWAFQRIGWVWMGLIVACALLGLLGTGPFSHRTAKSPEASLRVEFDRFLHLQAPARLLVRLTTASQPVAAIWLSQEFLDHVELEYVTPQPLSATTTAGSVKFAFATDHGPLTVSLSFRPQKMGPLHARIAADGPSVEVAQFVYP